LRYSCTSFSEDRTSASIASLMPVIVAVERSKVSEEALLKKKADNAKQIRCILPSLSIFKIVWFIIVLTFLQTMKINT